MKFFSHITNLLNYIFEYHDILKEHSNRGDRIGVIISIIHRIIRNLRAIAILAAESGKKENSFFMKLPVGILIRNCLMDGILAMHVANNNDQVCRNSLLPTYSKFTLSESFQNERAWGV